MHDISDASFKQLTFIEIPEYIFRFTHSQSEFVELLIGDHALRARRAHHDEQQFGVLTRHELPINDLSSSSELR